MSKRPWMVAFGGLATALALAAGLAIAGEDERNATSWVVDVHHEARCDGGEEDCAQAGERGQAYAYFFGEDGEGVPVPPGAFHWVGHDGEGLSGLEAMEHVREALAAWQGGGYLGIQLTGLTPELREHFGAPAESGVMVSRVLEDSPAAAAGLRVGDILTAVNGQAVDSPGELAREIRGHEAGERVSLELIRDGRLQSLSATVAEREARIFAPALHDRPFGPGATPGGKHFAFHAPGARTLSKIDLGCEEGAECKVEVSCDNGECSCVVNGEDRDCGPLSQLHSWHHEKEN